MPLVTLNAGSSSLKFSLLNADDHYAWMQRTVDLTPSDHGSGGDDGTSGPDVDEAGAGHRRRESEAVVRQLLDEARTLVDAESRPLRIDAVVHRIVHGGTRFTEPTRITSDVRTALSALTPLAPLHNPPSLDVVDAAMAAMSDVPHVAVFDTAFHAGLPAEARTYALPHAWTERWGLRRFGFHGLSHAYCAERAAEMLGSSSAGLHVIVAHLGNGASAAAVRSGRSVDTTMGFTPLEGLMMGTRSGSIDPGLLLYLQRTCGVAAADLDRVLNKESGLLGVSGLSSDMRTLIEASTAGDERASLAVRLFAYRARQAVGALAVTLGRVDALVFTGGIGEHAPTVRSAICDGLSCLGLDLDEEANASLRPDAIASSSRSSGRILVIAAREDVTMARAAMACLR